MILADSGVLNHMKNSVIATQIICVKFLYKNGNA